MKKVDMTEDRFWELVKVANWPKDDSEDAKIRYVKLLTKEECEAFRIMLDSFYGILDHVAFDNVDGVGDDGYSDLLHHIIGLGKETFYKYSKNVKLIQNMIDSDSYKESFAYCIPYEDDYKEDGQFSIQSVIHIAKSAQEEIMKFLIMDDRMKCSLNGIADELNEIYFIMGEFLKNPDKKALSKLASKSKWMNKACAKIDKFFQDNYLELPRKFTNNGHSGMVTPLFSNTCCDASKVLKYLEKN